MIDPRRFIITSEFAAQTVAASIRRHSPGSSWSQVRTLIERSAVRVNQVICLDHARRLREGDVVEIGEPLSRQVRAADQVRLLHVDHHLAVIDKPSGLTTERRPEERHWPARRKALAPTLDEILPGLFARGRRQAAGGIILVHRLDRDTSGVMVVARTQQAAVGLTAQFRRHTVDRVYQAVVSGHPGTRTISTRLVRDRGDGLRGSVPSETLGKHAVTHVREIEWIGPYSRIECRLETGRTNQIRIHLAELNCPVCGEVKYQRRPDGTQWEDTSHAPRLALHAAELGFVHPITQQPLRFLAPWPEDLQHWLNSLREGGAADIG